MLIASLRQMGAGAAHPLSRAAFEPFQEDFEAILEKHRALAQEASKLSATVRSMSETEEKLTRSVDKLLRQIYAYISWGIRHQADREQEVDQTLEELGFRIPPTGGRRLFDIVTPGGPSCRADHDALLAERRCHQPDDGGTCSHPPPERRLCAHLRSGRELDVWVRCLHRAQAALHSD